MLVACFWFKVQVASPVEAFQVTVSAVPCDVLPPSSRGGMMGFAWFYSWLALGLRQGGILVIFELKLQFVFYV